LFLAAINAYNLANPHQIIDLSGINRWDFGNTPQMYKAQLAHQMEGKIVIIDMINNRVLFNR
jgi:hypothetical protein